VAPGVHVIRNAVALFGQSGAFNTIVRPLTARPHPKPKKLPVGATDEEFKMVELRGLEPLTLRLPV
jgi:hypothetical protein